MEDTLENLSESVDTLQHRLYGVVTGKVIDLADPMMLGRVRVQIPMIDSADLSAWARVAVPMSGIAHGHYFLPNIGDEVLVGFENGDSNTPYVLGSLWNATAPPPLPSPLAQVRMLKTLAGNQLIFTEAPPSITIMTPSGQTVLLSPAGIQITSGANVINMTPDGITLSSGGSLNLTAAASVTITAPTVSINGATSTSVQSGGTCSVKAPLVTIN